MRLRCPYCGERDRQEFTVRGELAEAARPEGLDVSPEAMHAHVYARRNRPGVHDELWFHAAGCHAWLVVTRDTCTHDVIQVQSARQKCQPGTAP